MANKVIQNGNPGGGSSDVTVVKESLPSIHYPEYAGGAKGDGATDDWPAFEAALSSRAKRAWQGFIPPGRYRMTDAGVTKSLVVGQATRLEGAGCLMTDQINTGITMTYATPTLLDFSGGAVDCVVTPLDAAATYRAQAPELHKLTIKGSSRANGKAGLLLRENTLVSTGVVPRRVVGLGVFRDLSIEGCGVGINAANADSPFFDTIHVHDCGRGYLDASGLLELKMDRCVFWDLDTGAIETNSVGGHIAGCEIEPALESGGATTAFGVLLAGTNVAAVNNIVHSVTQAFDIRGSFNKVAYNAIGATGSAQSGGDAIVLGLLDGSVAPVGCEIIGNAIRNWGVTGSNRAAVRVYGGATRSKVAFNVADNPAGQGTRGIVLGDGTNNAHPSLIYVVGNDVPAALALTYSDVAGQGNVFALNTPITRAAIVSPTGGTTIDAEARVAVDALRTAMQSAGLTQ